MRKLIYALFLLLVVAHQDFWFWTTAKPLVCGFIPIGLAWHVGISLGAALLGLLAVKYAWPTNVDNVEVIEHKSGGGAFPVVSDSEKP